jgi:hypothetical protein
MTKKKDPKDLLKVGRKSTYNSELGQEICEAIASNTLSLETLCKQNPHWPQRPCLFKWMYIYPEFGAMYALAKERQVETSMDLLASVLEEDHYFTDNEGNRRVDATLIRVKIDAIKWQAGKLRPRKYGDVVIQQQNNDVNEQALAHKHALDEKNKKEF